MFISNGFGEVKEGVFMSSRVRLARILARRLVCEHTHGRELSGTEGLPWWLRWWRICLQCRGPGSIPGSGRSPGEGDGYLLQYSYLEGSTDRGDWWATSPWGCKESADITEQLKHTNTHTSHWRAAYIQMQSPDQHRLRTTSRRTWKLVCEETRTRRPQKGKQKEEDIVGSREGLKRTEAQRWAWTSRFWLEQEVCPKSWQVSYVVLTQQALVPKTRDKLSWMTTTGWPV